MKTKSNEKPHSIYNKLLVTTIIIRSSQQRQTMY